MDKFIKNKQKKSELENINESSLKEEDNNIDIGEDNNKEIVNKDNNFDSQTHDNWNEITRWNNSNIKNIYDTIGGYWYHIERFISRKRPY